MPVTVVSTPNTAIGPGVGVVFRTSVPIFSIPSDGSWRVEIHPHPLTEYDAAVVVTSPIWTSDPTEFYMYTGDDAHAFTAQQTFYGRFTSLNTNDPVDILVQLQDHTGTVLDTGTITGFRWDQTTSSSHLIPTASGGLTTDQATQLSETHSAVRMSFAGGGDFGLSELFQWFGAITKPPIGFHTRELIGDFSGDHSFTRPAPGIGVNAFGITWQVQTYGGGIGLDTGTPVEFEIDLLEMSTDATDHDGHEFTAQSGKFRASNLDWFFDPAFPTRVNVVIAPSVTIRFWWILARFP